VAEYIERSALIEYIEEVWALCDNALSENAPITYGCKLGLRAALGYAQAMAAADVVEVVRCHDCDLSAYPEAKIVWCKRHNKYMPVNGYCNYGARKGDV
jgi:hypothetical protein